MQSSDKRINTQDECLIYHTELIGISNDENGAKIYTSMQEDCSEKMYLE